ncbi:MAG: indole-3-glycerol phosphate synthase TrpC [Anaerolineales bacterium]
MTILDEIFAHQREIVADRMAAIPLAQVQADALQAAPPLDFRAALQSSTSAGYPALIAEIKRRSPSRGVLVENFDPLHLAEVYAENGAAAISVLTEEKYFGGSLEILTQVASQVPALPRLRKDFIFHAYQVYEARAAGADAVLLIAAMLSSDALAELHALIQELGMAALVEVHTAAEVSAVLPLKPSLLGINNRDLHTFEVNLETTLRLRELVPAQVCLVAESGIHHAADAARLGQARVDAILVGEALVTAPDPARRVQELSGVREAAGAG